MRKNLITAGGLCLIPLLGCQQPPPTVEVTHRMPVDATEVVTGSVERTITATGTLRAVEVVNIENEVPGSIYIANDTTGQRLVEGSVVNVGDTIARITGEDARLHARIESTRLTLANAENELKRLQDLYEDNLIAESDLRNQEVQYENALFQYDQSKLNAAKSTIVTPISGTILNLARDNDQLPIADGMKVNQGFRVAVVAPLHELVADVHLIGPELSRVSVGQDVRISHYAYDDRTAMGTIRHLSPTLDRQTHTFRVEVLIDNADGWLRPGMYCEVNIIINARNNVPVIPRTAITRRSGNQVAFKVDGQRAREQSLIIGLGNDEVIEIIEGLEVGDRVITQGLETIYDGTQIRVTGS